MQVTQPKFRRTLTAVVVGAGLVFNPMMVSTAAAGGIPVFDAASIANTAQQIIHMKEQIDNQIKQITELRNQVKALTGSRNMGNLLRDTVKSQVPDEWKDLYNMAASTNYRDVLNGKNYNPEQALQQLVNMQDMSTKAFQETKQRLDNIQKLMNQIDTTQDMKAAADLQNRIAAEQAVIQNNQTKLDMMARLYQIQKEVEGQKYSQQQQCMAMHIRDGNYQACK